MPPIIVVFLVDSTTSLELIVQRHEHTTSTGPDLLALRIDDSAQPAKLKAKCFQHLFFDNARPNAVTLSPGVYFFATDTQIKYAIISGSCRVALNPGKDPWPPPPPPAPQGTDLKKWESVYNAMFADVVTAVSHSPGKQWIVVSVEEERKQS